MKISYKELNKLIDINKPIDEISITLTNTGLEVEGIEEVSEIEGDLNGLVIGEVVSVAKHNNADSLKVCEVNVGKATNLNIVCGAKNVQKGQKVVVAQVGSTIYPKNGEPLTIKKAKIRGEESEGMLCSEVEISVGENHDGIMVLDTNAENGIPAKNYFNLESDYCIEIGLTPNRADAASHLGVARDLKAVYHSEINLPDFSDFKLGKEKSTINVEVLNTEYCKRFCGLEIRKVQVGPSPSWLSNFLNTIGIRPINNLVDISNYVNHFLGQPMHIFDTDKIVGNEIRVDFPKKGEKLVTLDGIEREFSGKELAINDQKKPLAIAGVFGGKESGVTDTTRNIFLEVAYFEPSQIRKTSTKFGLKTDASFRYERGTDPNMPPYAIKFATKMITELAGGELVDKIFDIYPKKIENLILDLKFKNVERLLGIKIEPNEIITILSNLDIELTEQTEMGITVSVPPYRVDVTREVDLIEEILRIKGFDSIIESNHLSTTFISSFNEVNDDSLRLVISELLASNGFNEIQTLSIVNPTFNKNVPSEGSSEVYLLNPLNEEHTVMRKSLLTSGIDSLLYNINRQTKDLKFFEFGRTYHKNDNKKKFEEQQIVGIWMTGRKNHETWSEPSINLEFIDLKTIVDQLCWALNFKNLEIQESIDKNYEFALSYYIDGKVLCSFGKVSSELLKLSGIKQAVWYAEFDWKVMLKKYNPSLNFVEIPRFPSVRRDLSLVIDKNVSFQSIKEVAFGLKNKFLKEVNLFDVYEGEKIDQGKKAYSTSYYLLDTEKTLTDKEIDNFMAKLIVQYETQLNALIRK